jgi:hypothetical protein
MKKICLVVIIAVCMANMTSIYAQNVPVASFNATLCEHGNVSNAGIIALVVPNTFVMEKLVLEPKSILRLEPTPNMGSGNSNADLLTWIGAENIKMEGFGKGEITLFPDQAVLLAEKNKAIILSVMPGTYNLVCKGLLVNIDTILTVGTMEDPIYQININKSGSE